MEDRAEPGTVKSILQACTTTLEPEAPARWKFSLRNGVDLAGVAQYDDGWLTLTIPSATSAAGGAGELRLLALNGTLPGGVRFARAGRKRALVALAELPLDREVDLARRLPEICGGLEIAAEACALAFSESGPRSPETTLAFAREKLAAGEPTAAGGSEPLDQATVLGLCAESGWPAAARGEDRGVVELDVPGGFRQAILSSAGGGLRVVTELGACAATAADACRLALAVLLLRTCGIARLVRAAADFATERFVPRFEVCFDSVPASIEVAHALAALSVACRISASEADALREDERLARLYLRTLDGDEEAAGGYERTSRKPKAKRVSGATNRRSVRAHGSTTC